MIADPYRDASELADELLEDTGSLYDHLRDAIWGYRAATGRLPERDEVLRYVRWCRAKGREVSGHHGRVAPPRPQQIWRTATVSLEYVHHSPAAVAGGRQRSIELRDIATGERAYSARTRSRVLRWLAENHPEGDWTITLPTNERAAIVRAWGEAGDFARAKKPVGRRE